MTTTTPAKPKAPAALTSGPAAKPLDWSWRHGPIIGPWNAASGVVAAGMVGDLAGVPGWWGAAAGAAGIVGITVRSVARQVSPLGIAYRVACMGGAGSWLAWALATSAWSTNALTAAAVATIAAGLAAPEVSDHEARVTGRRRQAVADAAAAERTAADDAERFEMAREWRDRFVEVCGLPGTLVKAVEAWPGRTGYTLEVRLPGGATWQRLSKFGDALASNADLAHGCTVEVGPGASRGVCLVAVSIVDTTAEPVPYPTDYSSLSFMGPLPVGMHRANRVATIEIAEDPVVIVGRQGSGKTTTIQVINLDLARCDDALIWHIDLNGAGMSRPWITPWLEGRAGVPVVDWVAATPEEALLMVRTLIAICQGRKGAYQALMRSVDDDKIPVSRAVPAIVLVTDEGAEAVAANRGNRELAVGLETLASTGRAARGRLIISGVRATADIIPVPIQAQAGVKIWMRPEDQHETAQLLGWHSGVSIDDAPHPGSGLMRKPGTAGIQTYRGHVLKPAQIEEASIILAPRRPTLDQPSAAIGGRAYAERWDRYRAWASTQVGGDTMTVPATPTSPEPTPAPQGKGVAGLAAAAGDLTDSLAELRRARERATQARPTDDTEAEFARIVAGYQPVGGEGGGSSDRGTTGVERMFHVLTAAGPGGMHYETLHARLKSDGVHVSQATLFRWLKSVEKIDGRPGVYRYTQPPS